jgi:hypothetical protein
MLSLGEVLYRIRQRCENRASSQVPELSNRTSEGGTKSPSS